MASRGNATPAAVRWLYIVAIPGLASCRCHPFSFASGPHEMLDRRHLMNCALAMAMCGCATPRQFDPKDLPPLVPLQDPPPGKAVVYLLRAPHDSATLPVYFDDKRVAVLDPATYTAVVLEPSTYLVASSPRGRSDGAPGSMITVQPGERRFLYVSSPTGQAASWSPISLVGRGVVPLVLPTYGAVGARTWKECSELDAQGLMSISRPVAPDPGAA